MNIYCILLFLIIIYIIYNSYILNENFIIETKNEFDNLKINKKLCIGDTCIDEEYLKILTGENTLKFKHVNGGYENNMNLPFILVDNTGKLVKWYTGSNFSIIKN